MSEARLSEGSPQDEDVNQHNEKTLTPSASVRFFAKMEKGSRVLLTGIDQVQEEQKAQSEVLTSTSGVEVVAPESNSKQRHTEEGLLPAPLQTGDLEDSSIEAKTKLPERKYSALVTTGLRNYKEDGTMLTFGDIAPETLLHTLSADERKRQDVIFELIETEKQYVQDLNILIEVYLKPIQERQLLSRQEIGVIFSNIEAIHRDVNKGLLEELLARQKEHIAIRKIGDLFSDRGVLFKLYAVYCSNQPIIADKLKEYTEKHPDFNGFLDSTFTRPECRLLHIDSFLIAPLQRICKYPLLLKELLKYTPKEHEDYEDLSNALVKIKEVVELVNERTRQVENVAQKLNLVTSTRSLVREGEALQLSRKANEKDKKELKHLCLFNDLLLMSKMKKKEKLYTVEKQIPLDQVLVRYVDHFATEEQLDSVFEIVHVGVDIYRLQSASKAEAESWIADLERTTRQTIKSVPTGLQAQLSKTVIPSFPSPSSQRRKSSNATGSSSKKSAGSSHSKPPRPPRAKPRAASSSHFFFPTVPKTQSLPNSNNPTSPSSTPAKKASHGSSSSSSACIQLWNWEHGSSSSSAPRIPTSPHSTMLSSSGSLSLFSQINADAALQLHVLKSTLEVELKLRSQSETRLRSMEMKMKILQEENGKLAQELKRASEITPRIKERIKQMIRERERQMRELEERSRSDLDDDDLEDEEEGEEGAHSHPPILNMVKESISANLQQTKATATQPPTSNLLQVSHQEARPDEKMNEQLLGVNANTTDLSQLFEPNLHTTQCADEEALRKAAWQTESSTIEIEEERVEVEEKEKKKEKEGRTRRSSTKSDTSDMKGAAETGNPQMHNTEDNSKENKQLKKRIRFLELENSSLRKQVVSLLQANKLMEESNDSLALELSASYRNHSTNSHTPQNSNTPSHVASDENGEQVTNSSQQGQASLSLWEKRASEVEMLAQNAMNRVNARVIYFETQAQKQREESGKNAVLSSSRRRAATTGRAYVATLGTCGGRELANLQLLRGNNIFTASEETMAATSATTVASGSSMPSSMTRSNSDSPKPYPRTVSHSDVLT
ncbi:RHO1 GDP-GTP exchange protein 2 [Balamuthia mandrillaris]